MRFALFAPPKGGADPDRVRREQSRRQAKRVTQLDREVAQAFRGAEKRLAARLGDLRRYLAKRLAQGLPITESLLYREARLASLLAQVEREVQRAADLAGEIAEDAVGRAAVEGADAGLALLSETARAANLARQWSPLPRAALRQLAGALAPGQPSRKLFDAMGEDASRAIRETLLDGLVLGRNPRATARLIAGDIKALRVIEDAKRLAEAQRHRARVIARQETNQAFRSATIQTYGANGVGWRWASSHSARTCPLCLSMDGQRFAAGTPMATHVACRCSAEPDLDGWTSRFPSGGAWLAGQSAEVQDQVLGKTLGALYRKGSVQLVDLVEEHETAWGPARRVASIRSLVSRGVITARQVAEARGG